MILGLRKIKEKSYTVYRNNWLEFCTGFRKWNFVVSPASYFDNRADVQFSTIWGQWYISIPFIRSKYDECDPPRYGFYFYSNDSWFPTYFVWCWGRRTYHLGLPWGLDWVRTSYLRKDGEWEHESKKHGVNKSFWDDSKWGDILWSETHPYTYVLKSGEVQERTAKIKIAEREWRPRWFKWTGLFKFVRKTIEVEFNGEVGERTGSWKGGTTGCGYEMLNGESALECLRRMERERSF
jgi:hypothetical protein